MEVEHVKMNIPFVILTHKRIESHFILNDEEISTILSYCDEALNRTKNCISQSKNKYYWDGEQIKFDIYHTGQTLIYYYYYSRILYEKKMLFGASIFYNLIKIYCSCDLYFEVDLGENFDLDHPVGSVIGRASFENGFFFAQGCTVGNINGIYPRIGKNVRMSANSMILGNSIIGDNVIVAPGTIIKNEKIPHDTVVFGVSPNIVLKKRRTSE